MARFNCKVTDTLGDIDRRLKAEEARDAHANLRRHGRVRPGFLWCSIGTVLDLSASGMRIKRTRPLEGDVLIEVRGNDGGLRLPAHIVWCRKKGFRNFELGVQFINMTAEVARELRALAVFD